jgi:hypothetical protein
MRANSSKAVFESMLTHSGHNLKQLSVNDGFSMMLDFYRLQRADDCLIEADGDMLLFEWGTYDWGSGEVFSMKLTRQLIGDIDGEDEDIWQLSLVFRFAPTARLRNLGSGNQWCPSPDAQVVQAFVDSVHQSDVFRYTSLLQPAEVGLTHQNVG